MSMARLSLCEQRRFHQQNSTGKIHNINLTSLMAFSIVTGRFTKCKSYSLLPQTAMCENQTVCT